MPLFHDRWCEEGAAATGRGPDTVGAYSLLPVINPNFERPRQATKMYRMALLPKTYDRSNKA